jgi:hypothetical protein
MGVVSERVGVTSMSAGGASEKGVEVGTGVGVGVAVGVAEGSLVGLGTGVGVGSRVGTGREVRTDVGLAGGGV